MRFKKELCIRLSLILITVFLSIRSQAQDAYLRQSHLDILHYNFQIHLRDENDRIEVQSKIHFQLKEAQSSISLDLYAPNTQGKGMQVESLRLKGKDLNYSHQGDKLQIDLPALSLNQSHILEIDYAGIPADGLIISKNKFGERTFFGDNWPNRAHHWLASIDHPSDKASCEFTIIAPPHYEVIANGLRKSIKTLESGESRHHWQSEVKLPTKVMVIGVADFVVDYADTLDGVRVESWVYPQDQKAGFYDYALAAEVLAFYEEQLGEYPFAKLANVQSTTRYGGMENAGNIFYDENSIDGKRSSEGLIAHEIAHQWFGNTASEADWHHLWLSEGFASYLTHLYFEARYGSEVLHKRLQEDKRKILTFHKNQPKSPIIDPGIQDLNQLLNTNNYQKGSWVLHMLRQRMGQEKFWEGLRKYYDTYKFGNAYSADFQKIMEDVSGQDLERFFRQWLYSPEIPKLVIRWSYDKKNKKLFLNIKQLQKEAFELRLPLDLGREKVHILTLEKAEQDFELSLENYSETVFQNSFKNLLIEYRLQPEP